MRGRPSSAWSCICIVSVRRFPIGHDQLIRLFCSTTNAGTPGSRRRGCGMDEDQHPLHTVETSAPPEGTGRLCGHDGWPSGFAVKCQSNLSKRGSSGLAVARRGPADRGSEAGTELTLPVQA